MSRTQRGASAVERWLEPRLASVPPALASAVRECIARVSGDVESEEIPDILAEAALCELDDALGRPQGRKGALNLLAVDASLTYAFEAAADLGTDTRALADRLGLEGELGERLLRAWRATSPTGREVKSASMGAE